MALTWLCAQTAVGAAQATAIAPSVVRQIDHILISSVNAQELFSLLSETFEFPVAWPFSNYGGFSSGGVAVGNVNLEVVRTSPSTNGASGNRLVGLALEPVPLESALRELHTRLIAHGAPAPFRSRRWFGPSTTLWTTVALPSVSKDTIEVFLCEYPAELAARRLRLREQLRARDGGPLSVQSVREIVCGATDLEQSRMQWQKLLHPLQPSAAGVWQLAGGPAIRLIQADVDAILQLTITVASLEQARRFLKEQNLLGSDQPTAITVSGAALDGLNLTLEEHRL